MLTDVEKDAVEKSANFNWSDLSDQDYATRMSNLQLVTVRVC